MFDKRIEYKGTRNKQKQMKQVKFAIMKFIETETKWYYQRNNWDNLPFNAIWPDSAKLYDSYEEAERSIPKHTGWYKIEKLFIINQ